MGSVNRDFVFRELQTHNSHAHTQTQTYTAAHVAGYTLCRPYTGKQRPHVYSVHIHTHTRTRVFNAIWQTVL